MKNFEKFNLIFPNSETFIKDCESLTSKLRETKVLPYFDDISKIICKWDERLLIDKPYYEQIFNELLSNNRLLNFIKDKSVDDIMNLQELIDPSQSQLVTVNDIHDLEDLIKLKDGLNNISKEENFIKSYSNLIDILYKEKSQKEKILKQIKSLSDKTLEIIDIFTKKLNKNVFAEQKFDAISKNGIFDIQYEQNKGYKCVVITEIIDEDIKNDKDNLDNKDKKDIKIKEVKDTFADIQGYKDLLLLIKKEESPQKSEVKQKVIEIIEQVEKIIIMLSNILNKGYDEDIYDHIQINLKREDKINIKTSQIIDYHYYLFTESWKIESKDKRIIEESEDSKNHSVSDLIDMLEKIEEEQVKKEKEIYENNIFTRLIYGNQFNTIYKYVKYFFNINKPPIQDYELDIKNNIYKDLNEEEKKERIEKKKEMKEFYKKCEEEVIYLNKFITNNRINKINNYEYKEIKNKNGLIDVFEIVNNYINELTRNIKENKSNKNKLNNIVKEEKIKRGFYPYTSNTPEIDTIRIFKFLTGNLPTAQNVLICSENTTFEEICSFLYRAFYEEDKRLYIMINSEKLNIDKKNKLISLLKELKLKTDYQMESILIFINKKGTSKIIQQIRELNNKKKYRITRYEK